VVTVKAKEAKMLTLPFFAEVGAWRKFGLGKPGSASFRGINLRGVADGRGCWISTQRDLRWR